MKEKHASLAGTLAREMIRAGMHLPRMRKGGLLKAGASYAGVKSHWRTPAGYTLKKVDLDGLPMELLERTGGRDDLAILQLHGGAYVIGFMDMYRRLSLRYSRLCSNAPVLSIDYRIAPAYHFPAALEDALKAWDWLLSQGYPAGRIVVAGDSAGGNLALALALKLRELGRELPGALVLMSPWADMAGEGASHTFNYDRDPMFGRSAGGRRGIGNAYAGNEDLHNPFLSPVFAGYDGFPPMLLQAGTWEMLLSDSRTVAEKARAAGADVTLSEYAGMFHVFQMCGGLIPESRAAWREVGEFILAKFPPVQCAATVQIATPVI